jgi:transposase
MIILDAKSIRNTYLASEKGYDGGKKVSGIKLHIGVDTNGLPHASFITTANVTDRDGAVEMLEIHAPELSNVSKTLCDGGYTGEDFAIAVEMILGAEVEIAKRNELHKFAVIPKRWVVERTFGWLENCRRLWKNCERLIHTSLQMTTLAFIALILNRW